MRFLLLNQNFYPDVMATGQYLTEVALSLVERGHEVTVVASRRAYDDPERRFPKRETWRGVRIVRVPSTGFGKASAWRRAADFGSFIAACCLRLIFMRRHDVVVALTTPPLISFIGAWLAKVWRCRFCYWVMDLNPDEAIAAGWLRSGSVAARVLGWMSEFSLRRADRVIALDGFMRDRILAKRIGDSKVVVIPPWSYDGNVRYDAAGRERFRQAHGLEGKFVVMYSGNHSPVHPLDTLLQAAQQLAHEPDIVFCFVGGGSEWKKVKAKAESRKIEEKAESRKLKAEIQEGKADSEEEKAENRKREDKTESGKQKAEIGAPATSDFSFQLSAFNSSPSPSPSPPDPVPNFSFQLSAFNSSPSSPPSSGSCPNFSFQLSAFSSSPSLKCLPYQPLDQLAGSLSAADLHVVVMGDPFVGMVHPCKIYNVLRTGAPVLYIGPDPSSVTEVLARVGDAQLWGAAEHGEVEKVVAHIRRIRAARLQRTGHEHDAIAVEYSRDTWLPRLLKVIEG